MSKQNTVKVEIPANTAWPLVSALGMALTFTGFLTSWPIGAIGFILCMIGFIGWFKDCYPRSLEVELEVLPHHVPSKVTTSRTINRSHPHHRAKLPIEIHRTPSGIIGGLAGGLAMAFTAVIASMFIHGNPWHPFNIVAATVMHSLTESDLMTFHLSAFLISIVIQLIASILVGLVYGAILPMLPRHPIILASIVIPFIWSFLLYESMVVLNPVLDNSVNWLWFLIAQFVFGLTAGLVVSKGERIRTLQFKAFADRAGIEENKLP